MNKKKLYILSFIIFTIFSYCIVGIISAKNNVANTSNMNTNSKVIVLDAGHGKPDEGAVGIYGTTEEAINLKITLKLRDLLQKSGAQVLLTRSDENGIYSQDATTIKAKKLSDIKNRVAIGNTEGVDIFVSIHLNKFEQEKYSGWQTFYQEKSEDSKLLASCIQEGLNKQISETQNDRAILPIKNIYIMDHVTAPTVTVECGFLSNKVEAKLLEDEEYQTRLAWGIYEGIQEYFRQKEIED